MRNYSRKKHIFWLLAAIVLIAASLIFYLYRSSPIDYVPYLQERISVELERMNEEAVSLSDKIQDAQVYFDQVPLDTEFPHYIYKNGVLVYWSDYRYVPDYTSLEGIDSLSFLTTIRHDMMVIHRSYGDDLEMYSLLPLADRYKIDNNYVHSGINEELFGTTEVSISDEGEEVCIQSDCLFAITLKEPLFRENLAAVALALFWLGILFFVLGIVSSAWSLGNSGDASRGLFMLIAGLLGMRALTLISGFPGIIYETELFDSKNFASSAINPSLGDLFINLLLTIIVLAYLFRFLSRWKNITWLTSLRPGTRFLISVIICGLFGLSFHYQYLFLQTLYNNSQLSFDINHTIQFDTLRVVGFGVVILNAIISFISFHILISGLGRWLESRSIYISLILGLGIFALLNIAIGQPFLISLIVALLYTMVLWFSGLYKELLKVRYRTFLYLFTGIIATSILVTFTVHSFEQKREIDRKLRFANQFLIENDNLAEFLLDEAIHKIAEDVFIQSRLSSPFMSKDIIRSKIRQVYLSNYFDKYDVNIHLYNPKFEPYDIPAEITPQEINSWRNGEYTTNYENIYFINRLAGQASKRYLSLVEIERRGLTVGYILIDMSLKRIIPDNVYPELLVDNRFLLPYQNAEYSYAVMENRRITYYAGEFNYQKFFDPSILDGEELYAAGIEREGFEHLGIRSRQGKTVVISSKEHPNVHLVSNFSFFFLLLVSVVLVFSGIYALLYAYRNLDLSYSAKIQLYLNVSFFLPLIAVSLTTLSVINSSFREDQREEYYRRAENISMDVSDDLERYLSDLTSDLEELPNQLNFIGNVTGLDINLFSVRGKLLGTSQPRIYENELLSSYINPHALAQIRDGGETFHIAEESVGSLIYNNTFFGVRSFETGNLIGILSIPFFQSANELEQNQIEVLTNVMNIFTVIFIVFMILSSLASEWLTFPLRFITQKLKKTTLTGFNEPLSWKADDEIGLMVSEYNRMLDNLEESKKALARSQKETAWREIAQQVAHEIKNPLTPMKLTLQHLSRRLKDGQDELQKPLQSLLHQVDTLSDIASSFSSFAKLPIPEHERYELSAILKKTAQLYATSQKVDIQVNIARDPVYSMGDEKLMGRILSNIVLNAIQAHSDGTPRVELSLTEVGTDKVLIEIRDYGSGIDESITNKIFIPNFTTKEAGSGIGLAVAKHGVEHAGGKIWFESHSRGTSFFIELPIVS
ncbi:sensor histidine kinase [Fulvivirga sedimenti]|uniref:histidine kinase n=1 Tax=Fulvivirga sedimenti TaxID=2879465 RepID=A0A9X1HKB9_9BACT|nr:HAMP domain-containing histidine kinase [Fulvivirga sedimenti]